MPSANELMQRTLEAMRLEAQIAKDMDAYQKRPKRRFIGARAEEYRFARYVEDWRLKIERIGNLNYPEAARQQKLYGSLLLTVSIKRDGSVENVEVNRTSGNRVLDAAAVRIVEMSGPFAAFPPDIQTRHRHPAHHAHVDVHEGGCARVPAGSETSASRFAHRRRADFLTFSPRSTGQVRRHRQSRRPFHDRRRSMRPSRKRHGQDMSYERLLAPVDGFAATVDAFARDGGRGLNVTVPFKLDAFAVAHTASDRAQAAGACNTLKREGDGWYADNTDGAGIVRDLTHNHRRAARRLRCAGARCGRRGARHRGAAVRGACARSITICNRTVDEGGSAGSTLRRARSDRGRGARRAGRARLRRRHQRDQRGIDRAT